MVAAKKPAAASASNSGDDKTVVLTSPWGSKVTVAADQAEMYKDAGFTAGK